MVMANTGALGNRHACAACKHQRRKCPQACVFSPYFPGNELLEFQSVLKIFGLSNFSKIIKSLDSQEDREKAVESIKWEARMWEKEPVLGPLGAYQKLEREIAAYKNQQITQQSIPFDAVMTNSGLIKMPDKHATPSHVFMNQETNNGVVNSKSPVTYGQTATLRRCYNGNNSSNIYHNNSIVPTTEQQALTAVQGRGYAGFYNRANDQHQIQGPVQGRGECFSVVASNGPCYDVPPLHNGANLVSGTFQQPYPLDNYFVQRHQTGHNSNAPLVHQQQEECLYVEQINSQISERYRTRSK